jgi:hypothetical protein
MLGQGWSSSEVGKVVLVKIIAGKIADKGQETQRQSSNRNKKWIKNGCKSISTKSIPRY